jgi:fructose-1,6-bisphosphatase/inositol monophosphatase family enzyme
MDSGLAFYKVASGEFDALILRRVTHQEWDYAAPAALILAAGGRVTDEEGKDLSFLDPARAPHYVLASNGRVHEELLGYTRQVINHRTD